VQHLQSTIWFLNLKEHLSHFREVIKALKSWTDGQVEQVPMRGNAIQVLKFARYKWLFLNISF